MNAECMRVYSMTEGTAVTYKNNKTHLYGPLFTEAEQ